MSYYAYLEKLYREMTDEEFAQLDRDSLANEAKLYYDGEVQRRNTPEWRERQKWLEAELDAHKARALKISTKAAISAIAGIVNIVIVFIFVLLEVKSFTLEGYIHHLGDLPLGVFVFSVTFGLLAIITGNRARIDIKQSQGTLGGRTLASLGLVLGYLGVLTAVLGCLGIFLIGVGSI